ncbi:lipid hydroperoxide peroxidase [Psittacicella melopsittaci]|uniref:Lipid hydroperoxide peroxidase n=1 Tax=Psittacicella melopsittaci TaxID=2028576 RepID=A0A3A1Y5N2_9GAMM|nr:thiol peroxidase [Psittacicella melopsittaci]RIY32518.1 lipid hydroperoxide peroxidase [Psittacicella melopsittaci]
MTTVNFQGNPVKLSGEALVKVGDNLSALKFTTKDLADKSLADYAGSVVVLNAFPSIDTGVCATSVREFNAILNKLEGTKVLCLSADLPFASSRFCAAEGLENVETVSTFRHPETLESLGLKLAEGPLAGLAARAVVVLDKELNVKYVQLSPEIGEAVDFDNAVAAVKESL